MRESYVLSDEQRKEKEKERNKRPRETLNQEEATSIQRLAGISRIFDKSKIGILSNWKTILQEIIRLIFSINIIKRSTFYICFRWILFHKEISFQSKMFLEREMEKKTKRFLRKLPFFTSLPAEDKEIIMEKNVPLGVLFQKCTFFNPSKSSKLKILICIGVCPKTLKPRQKSINTK